MSKEFYQKLAAIQRSLNAPKNQYNSFGKYHYRSCEDILEGVKPLLGDLFLSITDEVIQVGDRFYIKATATITDGEHKHESSAIARESFDKKGMDSAQVTGATSSYARKYCLNGLFGIDDSKDADTDAHKLQESKEAPEKPANKTTKHSPQTPPQKLAYFTEKAASFASSKELNDAYKWICDQLKKSPDLAEKANEVYQLRLSELEQAA